MPSTIDACYQFFEPKGRSMRQWMLLAVILLLVPTSAMAQVSPKQAKKKPPKRPDPTVADYAYAHDSERQKFDFWQAKSDKPTPVVLLIHGGGWMNGDKTSYGANMI